MVRMKTLCSYANYFTPNNNYCQIRVFIYFNLYCRLIVKIKGNKFFYLLKFCSLYKYFILFLENSFKIPDIICYMGNFIVIFRDKYFKCTQNYRKSFERLYCFCNAILFDWNFFHSEIHFVYEVEENFVEHYIDS